MTADLICLGEVRGLDHDVLLIGTTMVARRSQWVLVKQDPDASPREQSEPVEARAGASDARRGAIEASDEVDPLTAVDSGHGDDDSDSSSISNSELAAPLSDIIEKQRRMSESAQLLTGSEQIKAAARTPPASPDNSSGNNGLVLFVLGFALGFYVRGWWV